MGRAKNTFYVPIRYIVAVLAVLCAVNLYICRINLSIAIVAMSKFNKTSTGLAGSDVCNLDTDNATVHKLTGEFNWDEKTQGVILGAFFYGYIMFQIVGGRLSEKYGAKWFCCGGMIVTIAINALTPIIARLNIFWLLFVSRVVLGIAQSLVIPSLYALIPKWAPDHERSTYLSLPYVGANIGSVLATMMSGYLSEYGFDGGWPSVFYVSAMIATVWLIIWTIVVTSEPKEHPWISDYELNYIQSNQASKSDDSVEPPVPWFSILTSMPVIALTISKFTVNWTAILLLLKLPSYFATVFNYPIAKNGFISALVYTVYTISLFGSGLVADLMISKNVMNKTVLRKVFQSISSIGSAICISAIPLANCNATIVIALLIISMILFGCYSAGDVAIVSDMTSKYSATVFGIANTVAFTAGFITPMVTGWMLESSQTIRRQWAYVFWLSSIINIIGGIVFIVWSSAEQQEWDKTPIKPLPIPTPDLTVAHK